VGRSVADLEAFNEKASVLLDSSFLERISRGESGITLNFNTENGTTFEFFGPQGESVSAVLFTLRMFIQDNDRISIKNIRKIYEREPLLHELLPTYEQIQDNLNAQLDKQGNTDFFGKKYTFREALETYLYATGHTNIQKSKELKNILEAPLAGAMFKEMVNAAITLLAYCVKGIKDLNNNGLKLLIK